jgi:hypothetical protein
MVDRVGSSPGLAIVSQNVPGRALGVAGSADEPRPVIADTEGVQPALEVGRRIFQVVLNDACLDT